MNLVNRILGGFAEALLYPFQALPPFVGLGALALLTSVGMLVVFKSTTNQERIRKVKSRIHAGFFEIRLFNDDLVAVLRAQNDILRSNLTYLGLSAVPMLWMIVPFVLLIAQLQSYYGWRGLETGERALFKVELLQDRNHASVPGTRDGTRRPHVDLVVPEGLRVETPAVWIPSQNELAWRIVADRDGDFQALVEIAGEAYSKRILVGAAHARRSPTRQRPAFLHQLLYPAEEPLPESSPVESISVTYADARLGFFGWRVHWLVPYLILCIVFALLLKGRFRVIV